MDTIKIDVYESDDTNRKLLHEKGFLKTPSRSPHNSPVHNRVNPLYLIKEPVDDDLFDGHDIKNDYVHNTHPLYKRKRIVTYKKEDDDTVENYDTENHSHHKTKHLKKEHIAGDNSEESDCEIDEHVHHKTNHDSDDIPEKAIWRSCCFQLDPRCLAYAGQFTISMTVLGISTYMLLQADGDCNKSSPYIGIISFLLGKILSTVVSSA
jgi:hypothetical protein